MSVHEWRRAVLASDLGDKDRLTALTLSAWMDSEGACHPSYPTIADGLHVSRRTAIRRVRTLADAGWIEVDERRGRGNTNRYRATQPEELKRDSHECHGGSDSHECHPKGKGKGLGITHYVRNQAEGPVVEQEGWWGTAEQHDPAEAALRDEVRRFLFGAVRKGEEVISGVHLSLDHKVLRDLEESGHALDEIRLALRGLAHLRDDGELGFAEPEEPMTLLSWRSDDARGFFTRCVEVGREVCGEPEPEEADGENPLRDLMAEVAENKSV